MNPKILVFGNPLVKKDSLALRLIPKLEREFPEIKFIEADSTEDLSRFGKNLKIIDVSPRIKEVKTFNIKNEQDLKILNTSKIFSMHDFDLGYNLKLLKTFEDVLVNKTVKLMEKYKKPVVGVYLITDETSRTVMEIDGHKYKGVIFPTPERAVKALADMYNYSQWLKDSAI